MNKYKENILKINYDFYIFHVFHISIKSISIFISVYQKQYKNDVNDPDNHDGVITHLEPDILECKIKWALGSIITNKASRGDGIPAELFQMLKDDAVKVLYSICQQMCKTQWWPQDWKRSVFIPIPKNVQTTAQLHSSHILAKYAQNSPSEASTVCEMRTSRCSSWF